ncbi:E3 ubiquitin-protein ligase [Hibiscus syriacus]|uniref:E3 ubiquitin-protein ligase n=1 Tax=Hibiscus syriacus TaxID=106335 RepID=A0A6A3APK7_HIBSY|nr:E3 ubiquitin-protein ligase [Hibiscus syriacus]
MEKAEKLKITLKTSQLCKGKLSHNLSFGEVNSEEIERHPTLYATPRAPAGKPWGSKSSCLCSPTTHPGSFRYRYHRAGMPRTGSVGSKLSMLGNSKAGQISDSLQAQ